MSLRQESLEGHARQMLEIAHISQAFQPLLLYLSQPAPAGKELAKMRMVDRDILPHKT
jgi:hypothetical protein